MGVQNASVVEGSPEFVVITIIDTDPDYEDDHLGNDRMKLLPSPIVKLFARRFDMWLCTSSAFLSIVADRYNPDRLLVRARMSGHIEAVFPEAEVFTDDRADYFFRAFISRDEVASVISNEIRGIDYDNFKSSVPDDALHDAYMGFWEIMHDLQETSSAHSD